MKDKITIEDFEDKKYGEGKKAGRYTRFNTDQGWISSFDKKVIEKLKDNCNKGAVSVEIGTDDEDRRKITKFYGKSNDDEVDAPVERPGKQWDGKKIIDAPRKSVKGSSYEKDPVGLAVEVFCAIQTSNQGSDDLEADMEVSISIVKQAQKAFN